MQMIADPDRQKADRAMKAMLKMKKIDIATLKRAVEAA
jgi:predicted 3-demethylubiquinone-9 3-methyltransferase (glyoxalase superfamily)